MQEDIVVYYCIVVVSLARFLKTLISFRYRQYLPPIGFFFILCVVLVVLAFGVMASKRLSVIEGCGSDYPDEPSVYYSPKQSREELEEADPKRRKKGRENEDEVDQGEGEEEEAEEEEAEQQEREEEEEKGTNGEITVIPVIRVENEGGGDSIQPMVPSQGSVGCHSLRVNSSSPCSYITLKRIRLFEAKASPQRPKHPGRAQAEGPLGRQADQQQEEDGEDREGPA